MKDAEGEIPFVEGAFRDRWRTFWARARFVKEAASRDSQNREAQKRIWHENTKLLAADLVAMEVIISQLLGPDRGSRASSG